MAKWFFSLYELVLVFTGVPILLFGVVTWTLYSFHMMQYNLLIHSPQKKKKLLILYLIWLPFCMHFLATDLCRGCGWSLWETDGELHAVVPVLRPGIKSKVIQEILSIEKNSVQIYFKLYCWLVGKKNQVSVCWKFPIYIYLQLTYYWIFIGCNNLRERVKWRGRLCISHCIF